MGLLIGSPSATVCGFDHGLHVSSGVAVLPERVTICTCPGRPVNPADDRASVVAALSSVDFVSAFPELTPEHLIRVVEPDVYVKGGDYAGGVPEEDLVTALGGRVEILDLVPGRSTTQLLSRVRTMGEVG